MPGFSAFIFIKSIFALLLFNPVSRVDFSGQGYHRKINMTAKECRMQTRIIITAGRKAKGRRIIARKITAN